MEQINWGILATGNIANALAEAIQFVDGATLLGVSSRSQESADRFGDKWNIPRRYPTYDGLAADPDIDVIYIATPHPFHYENMKLCLEAGKHVLCEKPMTLNAAESAECMALAKEKGLFLMEALWMRFFPAIKRFQEIVQNGEIGDIELITADFCIQIPFDPNHRLYNPALGGGALLDLGIYPLSFVTMLVGYPQRIHSVPRLGSTGVDEINALTMEYDTGTTALITSSSRLIKPLEAFIVGSKGTIKVHEVFFHPDKYTLQMHGRSEELIEVPYLGNGYVHEVLEVNDCLRAGKLESDIMPHSTTMQTMTVMDQLRAEWGIVYPTEKR